MAGRLPGLRFGKRGEAGTRDRKGYTEQPSWDGVATHVINTSSFWCWVLISKQVGVEGSGDGGNVLEGLERDEFTRKSHHARPRPVSDLVINRGGPAERTSTFPQHEVFTDGHGIGQENLFNVLKAYSMCVAPYCVVQLLHLIRKI